MDRQARQDGEARQEEPTCWVGPHPDVLAAEWIDGAFRITLSGELTARLPASQEAPRAALAGLFAGGVTLDDWEAKLAAAPDGGEEARQALTRLARGRLLVWWYGTPARPLLVAEPLSRDYRFAAAAPAEPAALRLSAKALLSFARDEPRLIDPLAEAQIVVTEAGRRLLPALAALAPGAEGAAPPAGLVAFLARAGFLRPPGGEGPFAEAWSPAEWLYQRQTGTASGPRFEAVTSGPRAVPDPGPRERAEGVGRLALPRTADRPSAPFAEVVERRRSRREPGRRPPTVAELGTLLWLVAGRRPDREAAVGQPGLVFRNTPAGGALGELEFYLAVGRGEGLDRGFYLYDGLAHALAPLCGDDARLDALLGDVGERLLLRDAVPDCAVVLSSRPARLAGKYRGGAFRLSLLHVGVAYEALYLAATDLGLSACANGFADQAIFAGLTGLDPYEEFAIGQFAISGPAE